MFDELAERPLMSPLAGTKHAYVRLAIEIFSHYHSQAIYYFSWLRWKAEKSKLSRAVLTPAEFALKSETTKAAQGVLDILRKH